MFFQRGAVPALLQSLHATELRAGVPGQLHTDQVWLREILDA